MGGWSRFRLASMSASRSGVQRGPQITPPGSVGARKNSAKLATSVTITTEIALATRRRMYSSTGVLLRGWAQGVRWPGPPVGGPDHSRDGAAGSALQVHVREERHAHRRV